MSSFMLGPDLIRQKEAAVIVWTNFGARLLAVFEVSPDRVEIVIRT